MFKIEIYSDYSKHADKEYKWYCNDFCVKDLSEAFKLADKLQQDFNNSCEKCGYNAIIYDHTYDDGFYKSRVRVIRMSRYGASDATDKQDPHIPDSLQVTISLDDIPSWDIPHLDTNVFRDRRGVEEL